jgi:HK97 family phage prohead protease
MSRCIPIVLDDGTADDAAQATAICSSIWDEATKDKIMSTVNTPVLIPTRRNAAIVTNEVKGKQRAYSILNVKAVNEDLRIIEGIATTPSVDRMGDVIETEGIEFKLPMPLLFQHDSDNPIGHVIEATVSEEGIKVRAKMLAAGLDSDVDRAWSKIKNKLVSGLSIGFRALEWNWDKALDGIRFVRTEWMELSVVTIPANAEATILTVKSLDTEVRAPLGNKRSSVVNLQPMPPVAGLFDAFPGC